MAFLSLLSVLGVVLGAQAMPKSLQPAQVEDKASSKFAFASFLCGGGDYVPAAMVLAQSLKHSGTKADMVLMVVGDVKDDPLAMSELRKIGWKLRFVDVINSPSHKDDEKGNGGMSRWECFYTKMQVFGLTEYEKVVSVDADVTVFQNVDDLFQYPHAPNEVAAVANDRYPIIEFNSGMFVFKPSEDQHKQIVDHILSGKHIEFDGADQGLLNQWFFGKVEFLPGGYNLMNCPASDVYTMQWLLNNHRESIKIVHYVNNKPWWCGRDHECTDTGKAHILELIKWWWKVYDTLSWKPPCEDIHHMRYPVPFDNATDHEEHCMWTHKH